jgi:DNA (cytosine-5)-methyltransferase 1
LNGLVVDLFCGGGGASAGLEAALGRRVDIAINHSPTAIAVHEANHPYTRHLTTDVFEVDPRKATRGRRVDVLWASPDCTHFSRAKAGKPKSKKIRSLAHVVVEWARAVRPSVIFVENVEEFTTWGPLYPEDHPNEKLRNKPIPERAGESYRYWKASLELLGYRVETRVLDSSKFGAPTKRKRFFVVARCDGAPIVWPEPTHGRGLLPYRSTAEHVIDWSLPCPSIFTRKKPLVEKTLRRIAEGLRRYVIGNADPYIVRVGGNHIAPALIQSGYGERKGQKPRVLNIHDPLGVAVAGGQKHALVSAFVSRYFNGPKAPVGKDVRRPLPTVTATDHNALAAVTLAKFRGTAENQPGSHNIRAPLPTISAGGIHIAQVVAFLEARGLPDHAVMIDGQPYRIVDIGLRMLQPHELLRAQFGRFAATYDLSAARTKEARVRLIGNSVSPETAEALVAANVRAERAVAA